jgi:HD-GYP domain-containing protein (c-di-GMP phosphodiesterase class II)
MNNMEEKMIEELLKDIHNESKSYESNNPNAKVFIETIINNIYQTMYKNGQPVHTIGIGILRGNTFDMYYRGRILEKYAERFGAMSYDTTIAGRACELYKKKGISYQNLYSKKKIKEEFELASKELKKTGLKDEAETLKKRANTTIDQGIGSFLLIPISFGKEVIGIFTISSLEESDDKHILGENVEDKFIPLAQMLGLILYMEKISYDKAEEMGRLLISSIDAKDEYQATHSLNVRTMIDMFIDELSRDKELRERVESIGFKLTVEKIEKLRLAALLHDMGKVFIPSSILRKSSLNSEEMLVRKMHSYCTYNILSKSKTLGDIADIASMHHARYFIPVNTDGLDEYAKVEVSFIGYPFDRVCQDKFAPESQIIALADTFNAIIRERPNGKGLSLSQAIDIIENDEYKFHSGLKDIFLTIVKRVEQNLEKNIYPPQLAEEYRSSLWLEQPVKEKKIEDKQWSKLQKFIDKIKYNTLGTISVMNYNDAKYLLDKEIKISDKPIQITNVQNKHIILTIRDVPKDEGFIWINNLYDYLKKQSFKGKIAFALIGKSGQKATIQEIYDKLAYGLNEIKNEPVHYFLNPEMFKM